MLADLDAREATKMHESLEGSYDSHGDSYLHINQLKFIQCLARCMKV